MKKISLLLALILIFSSCSSNEENNQVNIEFKHYWNTTPLSNQDFNKFKFTTANGEKVSIERLRYLISNLGFFNDKNYHFMDVGENFGTKISMTDLPNGKYNLKFRFGFSDEDNIDGKYQDLNSENFNVPGMLGGGYHYMQLDGKYKDTNNTDANFNYHAIRAVDTTDPNNLVFQDTSFLVDLGTINIKNNTTIEINVNVAEWFKNPHTWNLNQLNTILMPNFEAQKLMSANGKSVFSLGEVSQ